MRFCDLAFASSAAAHTSTSRSRSGYLAVALGVATLFLGSGGFAAETAPVNADSSNKAVSKPSEQEATTAETAGSQEAAETAASHSPPAAEHHRGTESKHKTSSKHNSGPSSDVDSEIIVEGKQPEAQTHCVPVHATGSRLRKSVCTTTTADQQKANDKNSEQQAQDYLRRLSQQGSLAPANPGPYIQGGPL